MSKRPKQFTAWDVFDPGLASESASLGPSSPLDRPSPHATSAFRPIRSADERDDFDADLRRRRSSITARITSIRQAGGVNSIDNFARSLQRAAGFREIGPARRGSFVLTDDGGEEESDVVGCQAPGPHTSLLRQQIEAAGSPSISASAIEEEPEGGLKSDILPQVETRIGDGQTSSDFLSDRLSVAPLLGSSFGQDFTYSASYGSISSRPTNSARRRASYLIQQRQEAVALEEPDKEREPLLVKKVTLGDGTHTTVVVGQSTVPQTVFNSVNTLIGVGLLSLPLGFKYAGWVIGMIFLFLAAVVTQYTAKLLAYGLDVDRSFVNYSDVAFISFGRKAQAIVQALFSLELTAANVALVVLFADSLDALIPGLRPFQWKILCGFVLIPLNFVPLRLLAVTSVLGILCCTGLVIIVLIDGFLKHDSPGSLRHPALTHAFPQQWTALPLSFGLLMSPWGGHSVFPNIYRDMRHPLKYGKALNYTYASTYSLLAAMAIIGYLMFGDSVREEITTNLLLTEGYPPFLSILIVIFIAIIPLTKVPLSCAPIISAVEVQLGLDPRALELNDPRQNRSTFTRNLLKLTVRVLILVIIVAIAILFPDFDVVMSFMGSCLCFTICVILPLAFYLKTFQSVISKREQILDWFLIIVSSILAVTGTVFAFIPREKLGIK